MKKILSLVLAALMIFSVLPVAFADEAVTTEAPAVEEVSEFQEAIDFLKLLGIYVGTSEETFVAAAKEPVNRAQMALFTSRFITGQVDPAYWMTSENDSGFTDIEDLYEEAIGAISFASQKGIVNGVGEGLFDPETGVQYREAITMIVRALGYTYKASGYPWSYINKAREIGLLDGITGINYTTQINREVVAQLLYNALFVEIDGTNVAETAFNVGKTTVMITASNKIVYEYDAAKVTRENFVRFAEVDEQGEPTGANYHVDMAKFGLTTALEANAAVGTTYAVYYLDNCADIISAESLAKVYWNKGYDSIQISVNKGKITIDGNTYTLVSKFTDLNRNQGTNTGAEEMKAYNGDGVTSTGIADGYIISVNGDIYKVGDGMDFFTPYATYSPVLDAYYGYEVKEDGSKVWKIFTDAEINAILAAATSVKAGFELTTAPAVSAYTKATVSDNDRVILREYRFGKLTQGSEKKKSTDKDKTPFFTVSTNATAKTGALSTTFKDWTGDYIWSGLAASAIPNNSYVLYYLDKVNKEIEVIEIIDAANADGNDSYIVSGYVRGFDLANNALTFGAEYTPYTYDYDTLAGGALKSKAANDKSTSNNWNYFAQFLNKYVSLVVVDGKVVEIFAASTENDYVIIDSFVAFEEDGILANAWTTVDNTYTQIKIASYNGWNVGGFDYYYYILSGMAGNTDYASKIPFAPYVIYKVVSVSDDETKVYDLTTAVAANVGKSATINQYGYIEGIDKDGKFQGFVATADSDYWMILDSANKTVYSLNGKVNPVVSFNGVNFYKQKGDFVIDLAAGSMSASNNFYGTNVQFFMYNKKVDVYGNQDYLNQLNPYNYSLYMTNMMTGGVELVQLGNKGIFANGFTATEMYNKLEESGIYMAIDGVVVDVETTYDVAYIAEYLDKNYSQYDLGASNGINVAGKAYADVLKILTTELQGIYMPGFAGATSLYDGKVTIFMVGDKVVKATKDNLLATTYTTDVEANLYYVVNDNGTITAWIVTGATIAGTATLVAAELKETATILDEAAAKYAPVVTWTLSASGNYVPSFDWSASNFRFETGDTVSYIAKGASITAPKVTYSSLDSKFAASFPFTQITVVINRSAGENADCPLCFVYEF